MTVYRSGQDRARCSRCHEPVTWATDVQSQRRVKLDGHEPVAVSTGKSPDWQATETYAGADLHRCG